MRYITPILFCVWIFSAGAKSMATEPVTSNDSTLAIVNGEAIYVSELIDELMQLHEGQEETHRGDFEVDRLLTKLINDRLLIQEALLLEMDREPEVSRRVEAHRLKLAQILFYKAVLPDTFSASDEEIGAFFEEQYRQLRFHTLTVREKSLGDSLREAILNGSSFEELAEKYSLDTRRHRGGDHGFIHWIDIENVFRERLETLRLDEISESFAYREGFCLLRSSDQKPADPSELETYRGNIEGILIYRKKAAANEAYFENLRSKYPVEIDEDLLAELSDISNSKFEAAEGKGVIVAWVGDREVVPADLKYELMRGGNWGEAVTWTNRR
jgi:foldase protein PrsA